MNWGSQIERFTDIPSTMDVAGERARAGYPEGHVILSQKQEKGRGRLGREWFAPDGGLWLSLILRPAIPLSQIGLLSLCFGVSTAKSLQASSGLPVMLKWPNDILINRKKLGGILLETFMSEGKLDYAILGMGLNVNITSENLPDVLQDIATSLLIETGIEYSLDDIMRHLLNTAQEYYEELKSGNHANIIDNWSRYDLLLGEKVKILIAGNEFTGIASGINDDGALLVVTKEGLIKVTAGEVEWLQTNL